MKLDFGLSHGSLDSSAQQAWPHKFELTYSITLSSAELGTSLAVRNTESTPWEFQVLFHTYLKIDVRFPSNHKLASCLRPHVGRLAGLTGGPGHLTNLDQGSRTDEFY